MENDEALTGGKMLAISHDGNVLTGLLFDDVKLTTN
jgi:hypothetical protein